MPIRVQIPRPGTRVLPGIRSALIEVFKTGIPEPYKTALTRGATRTQEALLPTLGPTPTPDLAPTRGAIQIQEATPTPGPKPTPLLPDLPTPVLSEVQVAALEVVAAVAEEEEVEARK